MKPKIKGKTKNNKQTKNTHHIDTFFLKKKNLN